MKAITALIIIGLWLAAIYGWIHNIYMMTQMTGFSGMLVARIIGIFMAPLGAVLGYF